ncbi:MAG: hypothetical protein LBI55_00450 [Oscillospiraceae bacterium]|jgi:predicted amidohydrolase|nr:hypothetical protein [Oscillospiraceae bacterium]
MKVCIIQKQQSKTPANNIRSALEQLPKAIEKGADLICFQEWFLGTNPPDKIPNKFTQMLSKFAIENGVTIATGNMRIQIDDIGKKFIQLTCLIDKNGEIIIKQQKNNLYKGEMPWYVGGNKLESCSVGSDVFVVTSGFDSVNEKIYSKIKDKKPSIWIAQANEFAFDAKISMYDKLIDMMKKRSKELSCTIVVPMILGNFYGANYTGKSFVAKNGDVVSKIDDLPNLLICEV